MTKIDTPRLEPVEMKREAGGLDWKNTPGLLDFLHQLILTRMSAEHIARYINAAFEGRAHVTRNAVIGAARRAFPRLPLGAGRVPSQLKRGYSREKLPDPPPPPPPPPPVLPPQPKLEPGYDVPLDRPANKPVVPLLELRESQCKWPLGDPQEAAFGFCGEPRVGIMKADEMPRGMIMAPYCAWHRRMAVDKAGTARRFRSTDRLLLRSS